MLGGFVLYGAFRPAMQGPAIALATLSLASIIGLAWSAGGYNQALHKVVLADGIAVLCLPLAAALYAAGPRGNKR